MSGLQDYGHVDLPKNAKHILKTPKQTNHNQNADFTYCHTSIQTILAAFCATLSDNKTDIPERIILEFNIDGVKYSKSTTTSLWLIQMSIENTGFDPFVVGAYFSHKKPDHSFITQFVDDLKELIPNGYKFGNLNVLVSIRCFVNDTPANSFVRCTKGHAGYSSCMRCTEKGLRIDNCQVLPASRASKRTNADFRMKTDARHHLPQSSLFEQIQDLDMIHSFALDEMHIVHLGVMKKLIEMWNSTLNKNEITKINTRAENIEKFRPREIHRTIRAIDQANQFKANEFRTFLLITGPVLLKDILSVDKYDHFMMLHTAMRKLTQKKFNSNSELESVEKILFDFVDKFKSFYPLKKVTYVVHQLIHLCDDFKHYGCLKSAYKFENNCGKIVKSIRHGKNVAQQIYNRSIEKLKALTMPKKILPLELKQGSKEGGVEIFSAIVMKGIHFDKSERNKWFITKNKDIFSFINTQVIGGKNKVRCSKISEKLNSFFQFPLNSTDLDIYHVENIECEKKTSIIDLELIESKMFLLPLNTSFVFVPLNNHEY